MSPHPFRVGRSKTGLGLFATQEIAKGQFIVEYLGTRLTTKEAIEVESRGSNKYLFEVNSRWTIDGSPRTNVARYTNHSCRPNAEADVKKGRVLISAKRRIKPGEEITFHYGKSYFDIFIKPKGCKCVKCSERAAQVKCEPQDIAA